MASDSDLSVADEAKVFVTLTSSNSGPHSNIQTRRIALRHDIPERVGRASKVATKGFVSTGDNAWFDSPVMSRTHAELIAHLDTKKLFIKDIGSLHGTFISKNDTPNHENRLVEHDLAELASGDKIRFGIEILRGRDTFPPCEVDVTMEWPNSAASLPERAASTNHFTVPDAEDDDMLSDGGSVMGMEKEDFTLPDINQPDQSMVVDLTQEANPIATGRTRSDVIDLTSEIDDEDRSSIHGYSPEPRSNWPSQPASPAMSVHDLEATQEAYDPGHSQDTNVSATASTNQSSETSGVSVELHQPPEVISDLVARHPGTLEGVGGPMPLPLYFDSEDDDEDEDSLMSDELDRHDEFSDSDIEENGDMVSHSWSSDDEDELLDEHTNSDDSDDSDDSEGEDASNLDEPCNSDILSSSDAESDAIETSIFDKTSTSTQSPKSSPMAISTKPAFELEPVCPGHLPRAIFNSHLDGEPLPATAPPNLVNNVTAIARQPSPSDAAMVKMPAPGPKPGGKTTAQVLGEKTGKFEYFAARDQNKETVQAGPPPLITLSQYPTDQVMQNINLVGNPLPSYFPYKLDDYSTTVLESSSPPSQHANNTQGLYHPDSNAASKAPWRTNSFQQYPFQAYHCTQRLNTRAVPRQRSSPQQDAELLYTAPTWATSSITSPSHGHITPDPEKRTRLQSPEHDMTSAFTYQKSKLAAGKGSGEIKVSRRGSRMTIPDLLAEDSEKASSPLHSPHIPSDISPNPRTAPSVSTTCRPARKRTFDEVSRDNESEDDDSESISMLSSPPRLGHAIHTPSARSSAMKDAATSASALNPSVASQETVDTQVQVSARPSEAPPAKRRRLADFAACALGGAIGGAAVLVGLITSAPSISQM
ncbi:hypothetical protein PG994_004428 [Apiospora phragmitis]|uniref:FHA domain-containing protein n=1 Tax=Apiospora phragmitis TaxID=2905665 RepID=A0ABR1VQK4_9PEZI